ncbi:iron chelate uptake ABC transporter family permease subunit [Actinomycetota bacterium]
MTASGLALLTLLVLSVLSVSVGVAEVDLRELLRGDASDRAKEIVLVSRVPRTLALLLTGASLAVAGLIMQLLTRNGFVEPSTAGTMEFASLGLLGVALVSPAAPLSVRMLAGTAAALLGTWVFLRLLDQIPRTDILMVPLVGLVLGGVVAALTTFLAYRADLLQSLGAWTTGDFSAVLAGRYELLWLAGAAAVVALITADRLTVAGMGESVATGLGLDHRKVLALGMSLAAVITATTVVTVGMLPFLGLVVPNLVVRVVGSNARRTVPWVAAGGAVAVLVCDLLARTIRYPYELPIGTLVGVIGGIAFLAMLLHGGRGVRS